MTGDYKEQNNENPLITPVTILGLLTLLVLFGTMVGLATIMVLSYMKGLNIQELYASLGDSDAPTRNFVRWSAFINHLTMFIIPAFATVWFLFRRQWRRFLQLDRWPNLSNIVLGSFFMLCAMPLAQFAFWLNRQLPLPSWARTMEDSTNALVDGLLVADSPIELIFNVLVMAMIPAIGEELVFRGILQKSLSRYFGKPVLAIWVAAFIFSAFHMQFEGFLARMLLGAVLGYLFYWTQNLWVPIIAHFLNNALQIIIQYFFQMEISAANLDDVDEVHWAPTLLATGLILLTGKALQQFNRTPDSKINYHNDTE